MGLSVVHGVVQNHGGVVVCNSQPGEGAVFDVYLPVVEDGGSNEDDLMGPRGKGERLVLIDSEAMVLEAGANQLRELGYTVFTFNQAQSAVEVIVNELEGIDLVITEFKMPDLKALDLSHALELHERAIPMLVTYTSESKRAIGLVRDSVSVFAKTLMKPCTLRELAVAVRDVLKNQHSKQ
jgi:DNA-binding NtrC family response regulator